MKLTLGKYASYLDIVPFDIKYQPLKTKEIAEGVYADYSKDGQLIGIEFIGNIEIESTDE